MRLCASVYVFKIMQNTPIFFIRYLPLYIFCLKWERKSKCDWSNTPSLFLKCKSMRMREQNKNRGKNAAITENKREWESVVWIYRWFLSGFKVIRCIKTVRAFVYTHMMCGYGVEGEITCLHIHVHNRTYAYKVLFSLHSEVFDWEFLIILSQSLKCFQTVETLNRLRNRLLTSNIKTSAKRKQNQIKTKNRNQEVFSNPFHIWIV